MAKSDCILGRRANRQAFEEGRTFVASAYRRATNWGRMMKLREAGHTAATALRYSYIGPVRFADGQGEGNYPYDPERRPSVGYRIRVKPRKVK
jgi:hypothetical protein